MAADRSRPTVILANGEFPRKGGVPRRLLESARRIIACDGAAAVCRRRLGREADFVIGDFDSLGPASTLSASVKIHVADQDTNDLTKALDFCRARGWKPVVVGATGKREDHLLGNVFRAMEAGVEVVTDFGRFVPFASRLSLDLAAGTAVSVFAADPKTRMKSTGLEWPLDGVRFSNLYCATLNRATGKRVTIETDRPAFAFVECKMENERR